MNETFSWKRFCNIVCSDCKMAWHRFGLSMLVSMSAIFIIWMVVFAVGGTTAETSASLRATAIYFIVNVLAMLSPSKIYKTCNLPNHGLAFATYPASKPEKFLSMLLVCLIIVPAVSVAGCLLLDTLLALLPFGPFNDFVWASGKFNLRIGFLDFADETSSIILLNIVRDISVFIFFNTVFKSKKFLKTMLCLMAFGIAFICFINISGGLANSELWNGLSYEFWYYSYIVVSALSAAAFLFGTWLRLKKMKY